MAAKGNGQLLAQNALAVVFHTDQAHATGQQPYGNLCGPRVQRVVHQFAYYRGRALHHLASGNLADQLVGEVTYGAAGGRG